MKKIISFILTLCLLCAECSSVLAAEAGIEMIFNGGYEDCQTNAIPSSMKVEGDGSVVYTACENLNKYIIMKNRWMNTYAKINANLSGGTVWLDAKLKAEDANTVRVPISINDGSKMVPYPLIVLDRSGMVKNYSGEKLGKVDLKAWHRYSCLVNLDTGRYDIYIDGNLVAQRAVLPNVTRIIEAGFYAEANADFECVTLNDFYRIYRAKKLPGENDFPTVEFNKSQKPLKSTQVKQAKEKVTVFYQNDFEDAAVGTVPAGINPTLGKQGVQQEKNDNKYYRVTSEDGNTLATNFFISQIGMNMNLANNIVFEADVQIGNNASTLNLFAIRDDANPYHFSYGPDITPGGELVYLGKGFDANCQNKWVKLTIVNDFTKKTHSFYINGELVMKDAMFYDLGTINRVQMLRFQGGGAGKNTLMLDNIKIYSGTKPMTEDDNATISNSRTFEPPEPVEVWENEISQDELKIDMSKFTKTEEYKSKTPSDSLYKYDTIKELFKGSIVFVANNEHLWLKDGRYKSAYKVTWDDAEHFLAPVGLCEALSGETAQISGDSVKIGGLSAKVGDKKLTVDGKEYETNTEVVRINNVIHIPLREFVMYKLNKYYCESSEGMAVIADKQININTTEHYYTKREIVSYIVLDRPNADAINEAFLKTTGKGVHPRIYGNKARFEKLFADAKTDEKLDAMLSRLVTSGEGKLGAEFSTKGHGDSIGSFYTAELLYLAYLNSGDIKYAQKAEEMALLFANMNSWGHESYYLDVSFWMMNCAYVYDFFYDELSKESKEKIAEAIITKGLRPSQTSYNSMTWSDWPIRPTNWNTVCNGGTMIAAVVLLGEGYDDNLCLDIIEKSFISMSYALYSYAPHGALYESNGYWEYGTSYIVRAIESYINTLGDDFGLMDFPGMDEIGYFLYRITGSDGSWGYHDGNRNTRISNVYAPWMAYHNKDYNLMKMRENERELYGISADIFDVLFYMPGDAPQKIETPLDVDLGGERTAIATARSNWGPQQFFMGIHGATNAVEHGQYDMGNFIYDAFGIRFAVDIGGDSYSLGGKYFADNGEKSEYYVHRAEAHNCYIINPDEGGGQLWKAKGNSEIIESKPKGAAFKVDLKNAYYTQVDEAVRGIMLTNDRSVLVVQDEIKTKDEADEILWFWNSDGEMTINDDNSVTIKNKGKYVTLYFDSNVEYTLDTRKNAPLDTSPNPAGQLKTGQVSNQLMVTFYSPKEKIYFRCTAIPFGYEMERGEIVPISEWTIPDGDINTGYELADMIYLDGEPLAKFSPERWDYDVTGSYRKKGYPVVTAESGGKVSIRQPEDKYGTAVITIESDTNVKKTYTITFIDGSTLGMPDGIKHEAISAEALDSDANGPMGAIDGKMDTRWSGVTTKDNWFIMDLGEVKTVDAIVLSTYGVRKNYFDLYYSTDGKNYIEIIKGGETSGLTTDLETFEFPEVQARYIKLVGQGADRSTYNSYKEIQAYDIADE